jgi:single-strand DNA-binding protein
MAGINKVILVGHIGKQPDLRYLDGDIAILTFPLATSDWITKDDVKVEQTEWHNIVMWRALAETGARLLRKGTLIYLEGKIRTRSFTDKEGVKKYTTEIIPEQFNLLGRSADFKETSEAAKLKNDH